MNKHSSLFLLTIFFLLSVIGYGIYWFYQHVETRCEPVDIGYQGDARYNPLLASQRFLLKLGVYMQIISTSPLLEADLNAQDTLILWQYSSELGEHEADQLLEWVDAGGHLIMTSNTLHDRQGNTEHPDPLLQALKILRYQNGLTPEEIKQASPTVVDWQQQSFQIAFNPDYHLESTYYDPNTEISNEYGTHLLHYYYGTGMITVLSDLEFVENDQVGDYDHAWFFWQLLNFAGRVAKHVLLVRSAMEVMNASVKPSLWQLLWQQAHMVVSSAIILIGCWLWLISRRFGPLFPEPPLARRRLLEHIEASGYFFWRQRQAAHLLRGTQQVVLNRLEIIHPEWSQLSLAELSLQLAPLCGLPAREIAKALTLSQSAKGYTETSFTQRIQILTTIRKSL